MLSFSIKCKLCKLGFSYENKKHCPVQAPHGPYNDVATSLEEFSCTKTYRRSKHKCLSKRAEEPNLAQAANLVLPVTVKGRERPSIPSMYVQRLLMGLIQSCLNILMTKMI